MTHRRAWSSRSSGPRSSRIPRAGRWSRSNRRTIADPRRARVGRLAALAVAGVALGTVAFAFVFGDMGLVRYAHMAGHHRQVVEEIAALTQQNRELRGEIKALTTDPLAIESIARERLGMGRRGEVVYQFDAQAPHTR